MGADDEVLCENYRWTGGQNDDIVDERDDMQIDFDMDNKLTEYRGKQSFTREGYECQAWDSQTPHEHNYTKELKPGRGLENNYCRNPDASGDTIWCYTTDSEVRWDYCDPADDGDEQDRDGQEYDFDDGDYIFDGQDYEFDFDG